MATKEMNFEALNDEDLIKKETEMREMLEKIYVAKKSREEAVKIKAFEEIHTVLEKYVGTYITEIELTEWLKNNDFLASVYGNITVSSGVGRRAIKDEDIIFEWKYTNEDGTRQQTMKLDAMSKKPLATSQTAKQLKVLNGMEFEAIKTGFTAKFEEFKNTEDGKDWVNLFFPTHKDVIYQS